MDGKLLNFIQSHSPDGGFLQSTYWQKFQESVGKKNYNEDLIDDEKPVAYANIIEHILPAVGKYFYVPRGPVVKISNFPAEGEARQGRQFPISKKLEKFFNELINFAKEEKAGWIRIEPNSNEELDLIKENLPKGVRIKKSAVDVQPREILVLDITKSEEEILASMKQKTRYNIRLAEKRGVSVRVISNLKSQISNQYVDGFLKLVKITSQRDNIKSHPENYYRQMFETIPPDILKLYVAEYEGKIIAANLVLFFGKTATYMHGASDNISREVMAPYFLQWQQILDAKEAGCERYDFGGVKTGNADGKSWVGITKFKTGFAPEAKPIEFPGCYDIILNSTRYKLYRIIQRVKKSI